VLTTLAPELFGQTFGHEPFGVVALPGWMRPASDFRAVLDGLNAVAVEFPGFAGPSPDPRRAGGTDMYADLVEPVLDRSCPRVVMVGHSFGGRVALALATRHPERIAGLVLTGVPLLQRDDRAAPKVSLPHRMARLAHRAGLVSDARMEQRRRRRGSVDYRSASGVMRDVLVTVVNERYDEQLAALSSLDVPVELVWGAADNDVPIRTAERAAAILGPCCRLHVVDGVGHLLPLEHPVALRAAIDRHRM
jgi:pimeloyl-ACP methyl ester carboxylesterase